MAKGKGSGGEGPRINNRRATHDYFITAKVECGIALLGSEVKSLRDGKAQLQEAYARIENGELFLHGAHIDPYVKAALAYNPPPGDQEARGGDQRQGHDAHSPGDLLQERAGEGGDRRRPRQAAARQARRDPQKGNGPRAPPGDE